MFVLSKGIKDLIEGEDLSKAIIDAADDYDVKSVLPEQVQPSDKDLLDELEESASLLVSDVVLADQGNPVGEMLEKTLPDRHLDEVRTALRPEQLEPRLSPPELLEKNPLLQLEEEELKLLRQVSVDTQPIERHKTSENGDSEVVAVLLEGEVEGLVGEVEDDAGETEKGVEVVRVADDVKEVLPLDAASHLQQKGQEKSIDLPTPMKLVLAGTTDHLQQRHNPISPHQFVLPHVEGLPHFFEQSLRSPLSGPDLVLHPLEDEDPSLALVDDELLPPALHLGVFLLLLLQEALEDLAHLVPGPHVLAVLQRLREDVGGVLLHLLARLAAIARLILTLLLEIQDLGDLVGSRRTWRPALRLRLRRQGRLSQKCSTRSS
jgi:hypothetical protein